VSADADASTGESADEQSAAETDAATATTESAEEAAPTEETEQAEEAEASGAAAEDEDEEEAAGELGAGEPLCLQYVSAPTTSTTSTTAERVGELSQSWGHTSAHFIEDVASFRESVEYVPARPVLADSSNLSNW